MKRRTEIEDLRDETLIEILIRVPVKSCHQCKLVSKRWLALISSPYFVGCYRRRHHQGNHHIHLVNYYSTSGSGSDPYSYTRIMKSNYIPSNNNNHLQLQVQALLNQQWPSSRIFCVSNDLLLTVTNYNLSVSNPITKQCYTLPKPPPPTILLVLIDFRGIICSVDDPTRYKVVVVKDSPELVRRGGSVVRSSESLKFFVFSSDTRSWCNFVVPAPPTFLRQAIHGEAIDQYSTTLDGALYWCTNMIMRYNPFDKDKDNTEHCDFINLPTTCTQVDARSSSLCIAKVEQHLRLYHWQFVTDFTQTITVWDLNKDNSTWNTKKFVDLTSVNWNCELSSSKDVWRSIKGFDPNDGEVLYVFSIKHHCLLSVNLRRKTVELVSDFKSTASFQLFPYCPPLWPTPVITNTVAPTLD